MENVATCSCGSAWFELRSDHEQFPNGAVTLDDRGVVAGFMGEPACVECGRAWIAPRERLRAV